jgi:hypothetical protein
LPQKVIKNKKGHQPVVFTPLMAFGNLFPGLQAGPDTMTRMLIMPAGIPLGLRKRLRDVNRAGIED